MTPAEPHLLISSTAIKLWNMYSKSQRNNEEKKRERHERGGERGKGRGTEIGRRGRDRERKEIPKSSEVIPPAIYCPGLMDTLVFSLSSPLFPSLPLSSPPLSHIPKLSRKSTSGSKNPSFECLLPEEMGDLSLLLPLVAVRRYFTRNKFSNSSSEEKRREEERRGKGMREGEGRGEKGCR